MNKVLLFYGNFFDNQELAWLPNHLLYLTAPIVKEGFEPIVISEFVDHDYEEIIKKHAKDTILFAISAMSGRQITSGLNAAKIFRKYSPNTPIAWGGAHATAVPQDTINHELVDIVFVGHSEDSFLKVITALKSRNSLELIRGIVYKDNGEIIDNGSPEPYDLAELPPFPFHILKIDKYINPETRVLNYTASVGCPGACSFCSWGGPHRWKNLPVKRVLDDIEWLVKTYKLHTIWFSDSDFFFNKEFAIEVATGIEERKLDIYWRANSRVRDLVNYSREDMEFLAKTGLDYIFIGIEAVTPRMQKLMRKVYKIEDVDTIVQRSKGLPIEFYFSTIFSSPTETIEDLIQTHKQIKKWQDMNENVKFQTCIYTPYPGTPMTDLAYKYGLEQPNSLEEWGTFPLVNDHRNKFSAKPWFDDNFNKEYGKLFKELFPNYPPFTYKRAKQKKS